MRVDVYKHHVAQDEDGERVWLNRLELTRRQARRLIADAWGYPRRQISATSEFMRPWNRGDCPATDHVTLDEYGDVADPNCECHGKEEDGWMVVCDAGYLEAVPVWRCEWKGVSRWAAKLRRRTRRLHQWLRRTHQPVLWGGSMRREARWYDRPLIGRGFLSVGGSYWLRTQASRDEQDRRWHEGRAA
jgi:hypothetical protein